MEIDHLVVVAETLEAGVHAVEEALGVTPHQGGHHPYMGTHNRVLSLGPSAYLEILAIDPNAPKPDRPRWFDLDNFQGPPQLRYWAVRAQDMTRAMAEAPLGMGHVAHLTRGSLSWDMALTTTGEMPYDGAIPALLHWHGVKASDLMPDTGFTLQRLLVEHPEIDDVRATWPRLTQIHNLEFHKAAAPHLRAEIATEAGLKILDGQLRLS
ncbi:VOC family protein [Palleronia caenipelagi]|uniref:VOC family protein n=1 Tax=Palleronia caenipelagi TaxID=2489174 RepID=A0A547PRA1_9RHOB|nr:VOC family protein [Palleronia caenipelagi]TRD16682.1 VOC family protein [Palleronia caenipelagi]